MPLVIHDPMKQIYLVYQIPMQRNEMKYCERWTKPSLWYEFWGIRLFPIVNYVLSERIYCLHFTHQKVLGCYDV